MSGRARPGAASGRRAVPTQVADLLQRGLLPPAGVMVRLHGRDRQVYGQVTSYALVDERIHVLVSRAELDEDGGVRAVRRLVRLDAVDVCSWDVEPNRNDRAIAHLFPTRKAKTGKEAAVVEAGPDGDNRLDDVARLADDLGGEVRQPLVVVDHDQAVRDGLIPSEERLDDTGEVSMWLLIAVAMVAVWLLVLGVGGGFDGRVIVAGVLAVLVGPSLKRRWPAWANYREPGR